MDHPPICVGAKNDCRAGVTMGGMASPSQPTRVRVDRQGRLVLPQRLREGLVDAPGEVLLTMTPDGLLLQPATGAGTVRIADDGLPVLDIERLITNAEVLAAIDTERGRR